MHLTPAERETLVSFSDAGETASVYTHDRRLIRKLQTLHRRYPEKVYPDKRQYLGAVCYIVPKNCITVRVPYSDERRSADSMRARSAGIIPPGVKKRDN